MITGDQVVFWNPGTLIVPPGISFQVWPRALDELAEYRYRVNGILVNYRTYEESLSSLKQTLGYSQWTCGSEDYWTYQYQSLLWQANVLGVENSRIREAEDLASRDVFRACTFLVHELHRRVIENVAFLHAGLLFATILASILLVRFAATIFRFRNNITLQRRFYLFHGSHPIENPVCLYGDRINSKIGGCIPVFQN